MEDRTLDQQCTVTRPGLSYMACGLLVELVIGLLQSELKPLLGVVPHQIRYFLTQNQYMTSTGEAYDKCTACSLLIMDKITQKGIDFIKECLQNPKSIEQLTGLDKIGDIDVEWEDE